MNFYKNCSRCYKKRWLNKTLLVMKLATFIIFAACIQLSAAGFSQNISIKKMNVPLETVIKMVEKQSGYLFWYKINLLQKTSRIDINVENLDIREVLDIAFAGQPISYIIEKKSIILEYKKPSVLNIQETVLTRKEVRGTVRDSLGVLPGVSIKIKGSNLGTVTGVDGKYILDIPDEDAVLIFTMVGFTPQEISVRGKEVINVTLKATNDVLDDVVVVAFGSQKKTTMVGSVTSINPKELKGPTSNLTTMLAGRVSGVIAYQRSGEPGRDNADFFIRGVTSFGTGKVNPLILINGIEMDPRDLARIQPDDIAGFSVLKDASAAALFGARGANGVVLVTTKSGVEGKTKFNVRFENSLSSNTRNFQLADNITYMKLANEAATTRNAQAPPTYSLDKIARTEAGQDPLLYPTNDWMKLMIKDNTLNQRLNFNVSGGAPKAQYYISGTYNVDNGILKSLELNDFNTNVKARNYELRANVNVKLTPTTEAIVRTTGQFDDYNGPIGGGGAIFQRVLWANPVQFPAIYPQSIQPYSKHPLFGNAYISGQNFYNNPYAYALSGYSQTNNSNMIAQLEVKQDFNFITPGLTARLMAYTRRNAYFDVSRRNSPFYYGSIVDPELGFRDIDLLNEGAATEYLTYEPGAKTVSSFNWIEAALSYDKTLEKHTLGGMLISYINNYVTGNAANLQSSLPQRNISLSGRFTYSYDARYMMEFNFGYNGSERFHESQRFGFFPSIGVAWNAAEEKFMEPVKGVISKLKFRGSYGIVGNDQIGNLNDRFFYMSNVSLNNAAKGYTFGENFNESKPGVSISRYANPDITWERAEKANLAVEMSLFNGFNLELDFFHEKRTNILSARSYIPATMGLAAAIQANVGQAEGQGLDASLDYSKSFQNNTWLTLRGTFTYAQSKYLLTEEPMYPLNVHLSRIGQPISQQYGLIAERYFLDEQEVANSPRQNFGLYSAGDIKYRDVNGDGQITNLDRVPIGYPTMPEIIYGFGFSYGYKAFDISAFFQGQARSSFWINPQNIAPFLIHSGTTANPVSGAQNGLLQSIADSHWSEENRDLYAFYPRLSDQASSNNYQTSTWWMRNGSFLRLKNVELGFNMPAKTLKKIRLSNFRIYANTMNLFAISKFKMWDVEMGGNGLGYPVQRVMNFGAILGF